MTSRIRKLRAGFHKNRAIVALGAIALLAELGYATMIQSALPPYVVKELKLGAAWLGWIMATFLLVEAVFRPSLGALGDRIGRKPLLVAGPIASCLSAFLIAGATDPRAILALRVLDGLGAAAIWPTAFALVGDTVEERNRSAAMSVLNVTYMSGIALGPLLGGVISQYTLGQPRDGAYVHHIPLLGRVVNDYAGSQRYVFYVVSLLFALTFLVAVMRLPSHKKQRGKQPEGGDSTERHLVSLLRSIRAMPRLLVTVFLAFLGIGLLIPVVKLFAMDVLKLSEKGFGALLLPVAGALALLALPLGRLGDKWGKSESVKLGVSLSALAMWIIAIVRWAPGLVLAGSLLGVGFLIAMPAWLALISDLTSSSNRGQVLGAVGMAQGFGAIVGAVVAGYLYDGKPRIAGIDPRVAPLLASAVLLTVTALLTFVLFGRKKPESESD